MSTVTLLQHFSVHDLNQNLFFSIRNTDENFTFLCRYLKEFTTGNRRGNHKIK